MMKFSLNHSERITHPYANFTIGLLKFTIVLLMELSNAFYMLTLTQYQSIIYAYIKMYSIASLDKLTFLTLEAGDPFAHMIDATPDHQPTQMAMQRTTSNKNAWAFEFYDENVFGGVIPDSVDPPLGLEIDSRMFSETGKRRYQERQRGVKPSRLELQDSSVNNQPELIEDEDENHKSHGTDAHDSHDKVAHGKDSSHGDSHGDAHGGDDSH